MKRFPKRKRSEITKHNIAEHLLQKQLDYVGKTLADVKDDPKWYLNNTMTQKQDNEWKEYCIDEIKRVYNFTWQQASVEFEWFNLGYGLSIKD